MKIAITRLSGNVTDKNKESVGNKELFGLAKMLEYYNDVDILTCKKCDGCISVDNSFDINAYEQLFILNDSCNMFGGLEIETMTTVYKLMHKFDKQIYFMLTDLSLPYVDYYKLIKNKPWNTYTEEDFSLKNDLIIISQAFNIELVKNMHKDISIKEIYYAPLQNWRLHTEKALDINMNKKYDLVYGGSFRSGRREKKFIDYFFNKDINVELYGNMKLSQFSGVENFKAPNFSSKVENNYVLNKNNEAYATVIMGDSNYNNNIVTLRFVEALMSGIVCFIDNNFDKNHTLLPEYYYVNNGDELQSKIKQLKDNINFYLEKCNEQTSIMKKIINDNLPLQIAKITGADINKTNVVSMSTETQKVVSLW